MQYLDDRIFNNYIMKYYKCNICNFVDDPENRYPDTEFL